MLARKPDLAPDWHARALGALARHSLEVEIATCPKPGLVSPHDSGSHDDMDAATLRRSAAVLEPFFAMLAEAGAADADMDELRNIGRIAEVAMLATTGGVNTHRGAIFGLGLLCAAAGWQLALPAREQPSLGAIVRARWGAAIDASAPSDGSHGERVRQRHGVPGARGEAAAGFPSVYAVGRPALRRGRRLAGCENAARVETLLTLVASLDDTNVLHRGGRDGLAFTKEQAATFLANGGVGAADWHERALGMHHAFVARRLSPGGAADLLAMTLFVDALDSS